MKPFIQILFLSLFSLLCYAENKNAFEPSPKNRDISSGYILVISSYDPDATQSMKIVNSLTESIKEKGLNWGVRLKDIGYREYHETKVWEKNFKIALDRSDKDKLLAIITVGREAFKALIDQDSLAVNVPIYTISTTQFSLKRKQPSDNQKTLVGSEAYELYNGFKDLRRKAHVGGYFNMYDISANINMIRTLYHGVQNIAFLTDNSFGGMISCLKMKEAMEKDYKNLNFIPLDGSQMSVETIEKKIEELPRSTAILLASWRIDSTGFAVDQQHMYKVLKEKTSLPIFSYSGKGMGIVAIGGCIPDYLIDFNVLVADIWQVLSGKQLEPSIYITGNKTLFNKEIMETFGIQEYQLPEGSVVESSSEQMVSKYKGYVTFALCALVFAIIMIVILAYLIIKLRQNKIKLTKAKEKAESSERMKTQFLANMSHEIRTPLNAIVGFSDLLLETEEPEEKSQFANLITHNSSLLLKLINDILDLSNMESGTLEYENRDINVPVLINALYVNFKKSIPKGVNFLLEMDQDTTLQISFDEHRINQVLLNIMSNATKFTETGTITLGYKKEESNVRIYVSDTGIGIKDEDKDLIFGRFQKVDKFIQGTGLGLSVCKAIMDANNGSIGFDSTFGKGSTFWVLLPLIKR